MKKFEFTLSKMQRYKQQMLDREKNLLGALQSKRNQIANEIERLQNFLADLSKQLQRRQAQGMSAAEFRGHCFLVDNTTATLRDLREDLKKAEQEVDEQMQIVLAASKEVKSIDKLEERQREEYRLETARLENEERMELLMLQRT